MNKKTSSKKNKGCSVKGCPRPHHAHGHCDTHCKQVKNSGKTTKVRNQDGTQGCKVEGCTREHYSDGYCNPHSRRTEKITNHTIQK